MQRRVVVAVLGALQAAVLVLGTIDTLVWMPRLLAPGYSLQAIYAALGRSGDLIGCILSPVVWFAFWGALGLLAVLLGLPIRAFAMVRLRTVTIAAIGLLLLGATGFFHWWSAFGMGISVSDELPPGFGDTTPLGTAIVLGGLVSLAFGAVLGAVALATRPKAAPAVS